MKRIVCISLLVLMLATACKRGPERSASVERPALAVEIMNVTASELKEGIEVVGSLTPKHEADIKSQIPGIFREVYVTEWVHVKKGQPLARIDLAEVEATIHRAEASVEQAKAAYLEAQSNNQQAERELQRAIKLRDYGLATQQSLDSAQSSAAAASARVTASKAQIAVAEAELKQNRARLDKGTLRSSLDGVVALRDVNVGDLASDTGAAKTLFKIVDNSTLRLTVTVPSSEMAALKVGNQIEFTVDSYPGRTFKGKVQYINPSVGEADRSVKVIAEVENSSGELKGGLFAKGRIKTNARADVIQVPRTTLVGYSAAQKKAGVYIAEGTLAHYREVNVGAASDNTIEIVSGLRVGEKIVTRGAFNLKDGDRIAIVNGQAK